MMVDLDNFKCVNDTLGHDEGDNVLKCVAKVIKDVTQDKTFTPYRLGGDEFMIILKNTTKERAIQLAEKINRNLEEVFLKHKQYERLDVSASIGLTVFNEDNIVSEEELCKQVDIALYKAKERGKNCYYLFN